MFTSLSPNEVGSFLFSGNLSFFYFQPQQLGHNAHHTEYLITVKVINKWKINVSLYQQYIAWSWIFRNISNFFILDIYKHLVSSTFILITHQGEFSLVGPSPDENFIDISCSCDKATHWILVFILSILLSKAKWTVSMAPEWPCKFGHITSQCLFCSQWLHRFKRVRACCCGLHTAKETCPQCCMMGPLSLDPRLKIPLTVRMSLDTLPSFPRI